MTVQTTGRRKKAEQPLMTLEADGAAPQNGATTPETHVIEEEHTAPPTPFGTIGKFILTEDEATALKSPPVGIEIPLAPVSMKRFGYRSGIIWLRKTVPHGLKTKFTLAPGDSNEIREEKAKIGLARLVSSWDLTARKLGVFKAELVELGFEDLGEDAELPLPRDDNKVVDLLSDETMLGMVMAFSQINEITLSAEDFSRTT